MASKTLASPEWWDLRQREADRAGGHTAVTEVRSTVRHMRPWVIAAPVLLAIELLTIYAVKVLRWRPPALADLQVTRGRIEDAERVCHSIGHPAASTVCHHKVVLAEGAGSFSFPRHAVDSVDRLLIANDDRLRPGEHVDLWHEPVKPDRVAGRWALSGKSEATAGSFPTAPPRR